MKLKSILFFLFWPGLWQAGSHYLRPRQRPAFPPRITRRVAANSRLGR